MVVVETLKLYTYSTMMPPVRTSVLCALMLLLGCFYQNLYAGGRVMTFGFTGLEASGIDPYDATIYSQKLRKAINAAGVYQVLEFSDISMRLGEQGLPGACSNAQCAVIAGQILGVDYFGFGSIGSIGKTYTISMQIVEVRTGRIVRDVSEFHKGNVKTLNEKIIPRFALRLSGIEVEEGRKGR